MRVLVTFDQDGNYQIQSDGRQLAPGPGPLPAPPVLFLGSLAACAGIFAVNYLRTRGLAFAGLSVTAEAEHAEGPRRLADIRMRVVLPGPIPERHVLPLQRAVDLCTLKNTLDHRPAVTAALTAPTAAA